MAASDIRHIIRNNKNNSNDRHRHRHRHRHTDTTYTHMTHAAQSNKLKKCYKNKTMQQNQNNLIMMETTKKTKYKKYNIIIISLSFQYDL